MLQCTVLPLDGLHSGPNVLTFFLRRIISNSRSDNAVADQQVAL